MSKNYNPMRKNWIWGLSLVLIGGRASCKSSQSAYKAAYEKAQEKKIEEPVTTGTTPVVTTPSTTTTTTTTTTTNTAPIREQSEKINAVDGNDALLKSYNVIVGSFRQRLNAQSLCERLRADGYPAVLAQNAQGMYRVVACSFDDRATAVQAREGLQAKYPQFTDAWFLINK